MCYFSGRSLMITSMFSWNKIFWFMDLHCKLRNWYSLRCAWVVALDSIHTALCYICCSNNSIMQNSIQLFHLVFLICKVLTLKWQIVSICKVLTLKWQIVSICKVLTLKWQIVSICKVLTLKWQIVSHKSMDEKYSRDYLNDFTLLHIHVSYSTI